MGVGGNVESEIKKRRISKIKQRRRERGKFGIDWEKWWKQWLDNLKKYKVEINERIKIGKIKIEGKKENRRLRKKWKHFFN